jgi:hypothetical protein
LSRFNQNRSETNKLCCSDCADGVSWWNENAIDDMDHSCVWSKVYDILSIMLAINPNPSTRCELESHRSNEVGNSSDGRVEGDAGT